MNFKFFKNQFNNQEGSISLLLVLILLTVIFPLAMGLSAVIFEEIRMIRRVERSIVAFYAADTGIERALKHEKDYRGVLNPDEPDEHRQIKYDVRVSVPFEPVILHIVSRGEFMGTARSIEFRRIEDRVF